MMNARFYLFIMEREICKDGDKLKCRADNLESKQPHKVVYPDPMQDETEQSYILRVYEITRDGRIIRKSDGKQLTSNADKKGYLRIRLKMPGFSHHRDGRKTFKVHRLVAMRYLSDYSDELRVNHINGDKADNRAENLEMVTNQENVLHAYRQLDSTERRKKLGKKSAERGKPIKCIQTGVVFKNIIEAARQMGIPASALYDHVSRNRNARSLNGFSFTKI